MVSDDDPFAEPDDTERTVIRPNPGGRRPGVAAPAPAMTAAPVDAAASVPAGVGPATAHEGGSETGIDAGLTGMNRLNASAATLFSLVSRIRNRAQHMDPEALRGAVVQEVRAFENRAIQAGFDPQQVKVARYAICATLDDVVLNTPWGGTSSWSTRSMVGTFHRETVGGDRFYDLLARLEQDPARNIDLLEFLYVCLSLGFEGRLRVERGGPERHLQIREGLQQVIRRQRGVVEPDLSTHWRGVVQPYRPRSFWKPLWIAVAATGTLLGTGFFALSYALSGDTERLIGEMSTLDAGQPVELARRAPPVVAPEPDDAQMKRIAKFLDAEIAANMVSVFQDANTITVRITGTGLFGSGSDVLQPAFEVPLERVAKALAETAGPVLVVGHSDSQPIKSARFPSNLHLSLARAEAVKASIAAHVDDPKRLSAEGRADKEPIESNKTAEGRAANRRIEVVLLRAGIDPEARP
jgi:type VI secretion system protein ImpK